MAECVVSFLVEKIGEILVQEQILLGLGGVRGDVEFIRDELQHMRAFLRVAEEVAESDTQLGTWVKQVRCIALDVEDVLDEFSLRILLPTPQMSGIFYGSISKIISFVWNMKYHRRVACKILAIKSRITCASESHRRYDKVSVSATVGTENNNLWHERRGDAVLLEEGELVGIGTPKKKLIEWLTESDHLPFKTVSVVGMGGLGKTTLVKQVYDDARVRKHFHGRVWITVSFSFEIKELLKECILKLHEENRQAVPVGMERMSSSELKVIVRNCLQKDNFLIVFDDLWEVAAWEAIEYALPQSDCGSRVMLTTRSVEVASTSCSASKGRVYPLNALPREESWTLFCNKTFQGKECPSHLKEICSGILKRCEGLPLAIVAISGLLATKDTSKIDEWDMVRRNLGGELMGNRLRSLKKILLLSYFGLPYYLKSCMLYLSMFPEDYEVEWMRLVRLLIAEGFVEVKEGKTPEEVVISYLNELRDRSLIEASAVDIDGRIRGCRMHDLLREIILSKSKDQNFVHIGNNGGVHQNGRWSERIRRLSIKSTFSLGNVNTKKHISGLRSLVVFEADSFLPKSTFLNLFGNQVRLLTTLDMRGAKLEMFPEEIMKLYHLRYLSLRDTEVGKIPTSIGRLQNLETLDLKRTKVTSLPSTIANLHRLRHLLVYSVRRSSEEHDIETCGFRANFGVMGCLQNLQKLCYIQVSEGNGIIQELGRLNQLRKLGIVELRRNDGMKLCSSIEKLTNLRSLFVGSKAGDETIELQNISSPPQFLQRLGLDGSLDKIPHWISSLHNLKGLFLLKSQLTNNVLKPIQSLPNLVHLLLAEAFGGERLCFRAGGFRKLKVLWVRGLHGLKRMEVEDGAMPCLEELDLRSCELLEKVPNGIQYLTNLQRLQLAQLSDNLISNIDPTKGGQDCWKLKHIPQVVLAIFQDGTWTSYRL